MKKSIATGVTLLTFSSAVQAQTLQDIPKKYVKVCFGWLKERGWTKDVSAQELETTLNEFIADNPSIPGRTLIEANANASALRWAATLEEHRNCSSAPLELLNVFAAVDKVQWDRQKRENQQKDDTQAQYLQQHANDPVKIDYNEYKRSIAGTVATPRRPAGTVKTLTLAQYLAWEKGMKDKWAAAVISAGSNASIYRAHEQCKTDVAEQWKTSFGYVNAVLRSTALVDTGVTRELVTAITCMTPYIQAAGISVTSDLSKANTTTGF